MKSYLKILILIFLILLICISNYFIFFRREKISENVNSLTIFEKLTFNDNEKEVFDMLGQLKEHLLKDYENDENSEINDISDLNNPFTDPLNLKDYCTKIYEVKKYEDYTYIVDMDTVNKNEETIRRKIVVAKGKITLFNIYEDEVVIEEKEELEVEEQTTNGITININVGQFFVSQINNKIQEIWENSTTLENVNYEKIYKLI